MEVKTASFKKVAAGSTSSVTGAEAIIKSFLEEGVNILYGYPGGAIMPVYDELFKYQDQLRHVLTRHEQGAAHAAQGYARATGKVGVAIATSGPGATNLVTGIADAHIDSTPMLCITGQVGSSLLGSDAFQEIDIVGITTPVTKWSYQITKAAEIPEVLAKAFYIARSGRPGPVLIDITKDAQFEALEFDYKKCEAIRSYSPEPVIDPRAVEKAAAAVNDAKRPLVVFGQGVILGGAEQLLQQVVEKAGLPAAWTILGLSALATNHPLNVGMVGMHGNYAPNMLTNQCDVLIAIGMRFDDRVTGNLERYARQATVIHFEIDPAEINKNVRADIPVVGNVNKTLRLFLELLEPNQHFSWHNRFKDLLATEHERVIRKELDYSRAGIGMAEVLDEINASSKGDAIVVTDVGQHQMVTCRYARFNTSRSSITSGGLGTMGFALPAAIGAKLGKPEREVVAVIGDGGYQMTIQELGTVFQTGVPIKIVLLNNSFLGMVRQWQQMFFDRRYASTEMMNPDFTGIAAGYHIQARKVSERKDLKAAVTEMLQARGAYFLEVQVEKEDNVFPMIPPGSSVSEILLE